MGIPIDGNIETFKQMLVQQKGFKLTNLDKNEEKFSYFEMFDVENGLFVGMPVERIFIYSSPLTKTVYRVILNFVVDSKEEGDNFINRVISVAKKKYNPSVSSLVPFSRPGVSLDFSEGMICVSDTYEYNGKFRLIILYSDNLNGRNATRETRKIEKMEENDI